ncbi:unnamed protein product [Cercospora beticola]|nr:unnamed protein product [Cercospora beticola]
MRRFQFTDKQSSPYIGAATYAVDKYALAAGDRPPGGASSRVRSLSRIPKGPLSERLLAHGMELGKPSAKSDKICGELQLLHAIPEVQPVQSCKKVDSMVEHPSRRNGRSDRFRSMVLRMLHEYGVVFRKGQKLRGLV